MLWHHRGSQTAGVTKGAAVCDGAVAVLPFPSDLQPKKQFYVLKKYLLKKLFSICAGE